MTGSGVEEDEIGLALSVEFAGDGEHLVERDRDDVLVPVDDVAAVEDVVGTRGGCGSGGVGRSSGTDGRSAWAG